MALSVVDAMLHIFQMPRPALLRGSWLIQEFAGKSVVLFLNFWLCFILKCFS